MIETKARKIELLAPAGDFASLVAAVKAGADAVYLGLKEKGLNMRASAKNFSINDFKKIKKICGSKNVKIYLTLNTIIYDDEIKKVEKIIKKAKKYIDAVICWDFSVIYLCKKYKIPFHISTQASVSNKKSALFYKNLGAERIILARELNLKQIKEIAKIIDVECFIHGAMCVSVSGRCFTSQFLFKKSANRGECMHPCRRAYIVRDEEGNELKLENNNIMSAKDLCSLPFIERLKKAGIRAFKIEGRNKEPEYVSTVVNVYRAAIDKNLTKKEICDGLKELNKVYNKGFSSGFYLGYPTNDDFSKIEHSSSKQTKKFIGKVVHYFSAKQVAAIKICAGNIKVGQELIIIGKETGVIKQRIGRIELNKKSIKKAEKGQIVGIRIPGARKNCDVYAVVKKENPNRK